jgi:rRNA maturation RNase YbeY
MITIKNRVKKIKISTNRVRSNIKKMLEAAGYPDFDIGVWFTTNKTIRIYNKKYRKQDKPTDILSFPYHHLKPGQKITISSPDDKNLGDMIISLEYAKKDATAQNRSLMEHVNILLAHGLAHLLGYDHKTQAQYKRMQEKERELLIKTGLRYPAPLHR